MTKLPPFLMDPFRQGDPVETDLAGRSSRLTVDSLLTCAKASGGWGRSFVGPWEQYRAEELWEMSSSLWPLQPWGFLRVGGGPFIWNLSGEVRIH